MHAAPPATWVPDEGYLIIYGYLYILRNCINIVIGYSTKEHRFITKVSLIVKQLPVGLIEFQALVAVQLAGRMEEPMLVSSG
jgi:hypothetical protein